MKECNFNKPDYSRDVIDDLKALSCCRQGHGIADGCSACPFVKDKPDRYKCNPYNRLVDSIKEIMAQFSEEQADHFVRVINKCSLCEEYCDTDCPYFNESIEERAEVFFQHVYDFLKAQGLYNTDGTVSEKGAQIRVSDTLALLMTTGLTKDSWTEERGGLLF